MMRAGIVAASLMLAGCGQTLTPGQQALLNDLSVLGVRAACLEINRQYARIEKPNMAQAAAMGFVVNACADPRATAGDIASAARELVALMKG